MKIAIVMANGMDGYGATTWAVELSKYLTNRGIENGLYCYDRFISKNRPKSTFTVVDDWQAFSQEIVTAGYTNAIFPSLPKENLGIDTCLGFVEFLRAIKGRVSLTSYILENITSTGFKIPFILRILALMDVIGHYNVDTWLGQYVVKLGMQDRFRQFPAVYDVEGHLAEANRYMMENNCEIENRPPGICTAGRGASWKRYDDSVRLMRKVHDLDPTWKMNLYGYQGGTGCQSLWLQHEHKDYIKVICGKGDGTYPDTYITNRSEPPIVATSGYSHTVLPGLLTQHSFGNSFYQLADRHGYGSKLEYAQMEMMLYTVGVFSGHTLNGNFSHHDNNKKFIDYPAFCITMDPANITDLDARDLLDVYADKPLMRTLMHNAVDFMQAECGWDTCDNFMGIFGHDTSATIEDVMIDRLYRDGVAAEVKAAIPDGKKWMWNSPYSIKNGQISVYDEATLAVEKFKLPFKVKLAIATTDESDE
jgi:hypothetical protein